MKVCINGDRLDGMKDIRDRRESSALQGVTICINGDRSDGK